MDSTKATKPFKQSFKEFKENRKVGMQEALTLKKGTLARFAISITTLGVVSLLGLSVWLERHSIYFNAFKLRAGLNFSGGVIDTFKINEFCAREDFLNIVKDHFAKDGLNWELGFDGKGGFETYFDYFHNKLNNFQRFEFEKLTLEYFQKNPSEINEYFGNNANFQKFAKYVEGEEAAAIKAGHDAVTKRIIIMAVVAALLIGIAVGICVYLKKCQNNHKDMDEGFSKKIGEYLDEEKNLLIPCLRPSDPEMRAVKARREAKVAEEREKPLLGSSSGESSTASSNRRVVASDPSVSSGSGGGLSSNTTGKIPYSERSTIAQAARQRLNRSKNGGRYADANNDATQQQNTSERTQLFAPSNKKSNNGQSSSTVENLVERADGLNLQSISTKVTVPASGGGGLFNKLFGNKK